MGFVGSFDLILHYTARSPFVLTNHPGTVNYVPIHFLYKSISPDELAALYASADVCFICSTRDGLNLVCYEYVACHDHGSPGNTPPGVLLLSKFAGASSTLKGCLIVNPWDKSHCANTLAQALTMDASEAKERIAEMRSTVNQQTRCARTLHV